MNTEITILETREIAGSLYTIYGTFEEPLFLAQDVADVLGNNRADKMVQKVDDDEKIKMAFKRTSSQSTQTQWFLTEDGLYETLMQSRKPIAKKFKKEVKVILKCIRKNGGYISDNATKEQVEHLDENNLIQLANDGKKVGKRIKRIFTGLTPNEVLEKLDYIYPLVNSGVRYYFLDSLYNNIIGVQKEYATQAISDGSLDTTVYDGYNKIMLFAKTEALKFKNRSDGKIIAALKKKVSRSDDVSVFEDKIKHLEARVPKIIFNQNLDELEDVYDTSNDEYRVVMTPAEGSFGPYFRFKMTEVKDTTFELECNFNQYLVTKNIKLGTYEYKVELTDTGVDLLCTVTKVYIEPTAYDMEDF